MLKKTPNNGNALGEAFLAGVLDSFHEQVAVIDAEGELLWVNEAWINFSAENGGIVGEVLISQNYLDVTRTSAEAGDQIAAAAYKGILRTIAGELDSFEIEYPCDSPTETRWISMHMRPLPMEGKPTFSIVHRNVTVRRMAELSLQNAYRDLDQKIKDRTEQLARREKEFRLLYENTPAMLHSIDATGTIINVTNHWLSVLGYSREEVIGQRSTAFLTAESQRYAIEEALPAFFETGRCDNIPYQMVKRDGSIINVLLSAIAEHNEDGSIRQSLAVITDVTEQLRMDAARAAAEVEREKAFVLAESASQAKSEFMASMSHELRTPLNSILGFSEMIHDEILGPIGTEVYKGYAADITFSASHLLDLVNQILDVERIEAGQYEISKSNFCLHELLRECERLINIQAHEKGVEVFFDYTNTRTKMNADRRAIFQVLVNILSNAVKFTEKGGTVEVHVSCKNGWQSIEFRDSGIGIPSEKIRAVQQPFARHDNNPHMYQEGVGLGLAIASSLVELHDGRLTIESMVGIGTSVTVHLPEPKAPSD